MATLSDLIAQRNELEQKIQEQTQAQRADAIAKVRALMEENGLSVADFRSGSGRGPAKEKASANAGTKVAAKYRDDAGNSWSGRGLQPKWLKAALEGSGKKIEDFAV